MRQTLRSAGSEFSDTKVGRYLCGLATAAAGLLDLIWGDFEAAHQPIGAFGDHIPGRATLAYITGSIMILAGTAMLFRRTARAGSSGTAIIYLVFGLFWLPRFYTAPHALGFHLTVFIGLLNGVFTQLVVVAGALIVYASAAPSASVWPERAPIIARWFLGIGSILFGLGHLTSVASLTEMIPNWMPATPSFWVVTTGIAFLLAGVAILTEILNVFATYLLALMLLMFELALVPAVIAYPRMHIPWGANAYNLAASGATLIFAEWLKPKSINRS
jgi:uncharacterized membrane protein